MVRGFDSNTKQMHVFFGEERMPTDPGMSVTYSFDSSTHDLRYLCYMIKKLKGSCRPPPESMMSAYKPEPVSVEEVASRYAVSLRQARRWKAQGQIVLNEADGNVRTLVDERQFQELARSKKGRSRVQRTVTFANHCQRRKMDPKSTLEKILLATPSLEAAPVTHDIDLAAAGIRLALASRSDFLLYLSLQKEPDGTFASEIARLLGPDRALVISGQVPISEFQDHWLTWKRVMLLGKTPASWLREDSFEAVREMTDGATPKYLKRICSEDLPKWAKKSVVPARQTDDVKDAIRDLTAFAARSPELKRFLETAKKTVEGMTPDLVTPSGLASERYAVIEEDIKVLTGYLVDHFKVPRKTARIYWWALFRMIHHDKLVESRQLNSDEWKGPAAPKRLSRAAINRIFGSSRAAKI
jgi:hypothetical protein